MSKKNLLVFLAICASSSVLLAQEMNPTATDKWPQTQDQRKQPQAEMRDGVAVYKVEVVGRDIPAINYFHRSGATKIGFEGTSLLPGAKGSAEVSSERGRMVIKARFQGLKPANSFGIEYLTYVLWAITPEGRPINLGEILPEGTKNDITVTTDLQSFGLVVTAEPYFAVTMPSDVVVLQNTILHDKTAGILEQINAHYSLLPRGAYEKTASQNAVLHPITRNEKSPLELYEAINAIQIAEAAGAKKYAPETLATAQQDLQNAQAMDTHKSNRKQEITYAREAVQASEDARIMSIRKQKAEDAARRQQAQEQAEQAAQQAQLEAQQQATKRAQAEAQASEAEAQAAKAQAQAALAQHAQQQAVDQTAQMRERLKQQLNQVLSTRETARGLIINMSDVLFAFNKYDLKPDAREKLAKVSGILLAYPDLKLQIEGYTDNVGSQQYNEKLSQERADAVRDYLVSQGVAQGNIVATGYGENNPIAENSTANGRAQNRRVQLVVSGNSIGVQEKAPGAGNDAQPAPPSPPQTPNNTGVSNVPPQ
ncbi:MAG: OmpA family protein [Acidobacteria bacterium]|nr:OmpA family protein [Acidobacteriota bacterium]